MTKEELIDKWRDAFHKLLELRGQLSHAAFTEAEPLALVIKDALKLETASDVNSFAAIEEKLKSE